MNKNRPHHLQLLEAARVFFNPRMSIILLLGFSSGLPLALSGSTLAIWVKDVGGDLRTIGLYTLVGLPYTLKFIWAPMLDAWRVPLLSRWLGHRRSWMLFSQILLGAAILFLGSLDPIAAPLTLALGALIVATASATQDIVIDAFRVEYLKNDEQATGMAYFVATYRIGMLAAGAGVILLVAWLQSQGMDQKNIWFYGYAAMAFLMIPGICATFLAHEPSYEQTDRSGSRSADDGSASGKGAFSRLRQTIHRSFSDFLSKKQAIAILLFIILYKLGDAFAGVMTGPFVLDIGFSKESYATIVKGIGLVASLTGGLAGGLITRIKPMGQALLITGILQTFSNAGFMWQAWIGVSHLSLTTVIFIENFTGAMATVTFVAYLSALCNNPLHTATQFALLSSLSSIGRVLLSSMSGFVASATSWFLFFGLTIFTALPGLFVLIWLQRQGHFKTLQKE